MIRERYGIDTGLIRGRYENDTRTMFPDTQQRKLIRNLTFSLLFWCIIFYILLFRCVLHLVQRWLGVQIAIVEQLYKDNLPFSRMQVD